MKADEGWWMLMKVDECWWRLFKVDECWWNLVNVDEGWWMLMKVDECWWRLMNVDEGWWRLMKVDETTYGTVTWYWYAQNMLQDVVIAIPPWESKDPLGMHIPMDGPGHCPRWNDAWNVDKLIRNDLRISIISQPSSYDHVWICMDILMIISLRFRSSMGLTLIQRGFGRCWWDNSLKRHRHGAFGCILRPCKERDIEIFGYI